jgi:succinate-semialdehyde dehydrogenase/glutarate-semialdehyde dehydrogenase
MITTTQQPVSTDADREPIHVKNPVTGDLLATVPNTGPDGVRAAVERARASQPAWEARGNRGRARFLQLWARALWRDRERLIGVIRSETGKNETGALLELIVLDNVLTYYAHHAPRMLRPRRRGTLFPVVQYARVYYRPFGVAGFISPWNYPYLNALMDAVAALVAGNTVVIKPSEVTPLSALYAVAIAHQVSIPRDALQIITGDGQTGAALVDEVDHISVTGSTATGRTVARRAAERLIPCNLELGGKDPLIVLPDANIDLAATSVLQGALENAGQVCVSTERVYDQFVDRIIHYAQQLTIGAGDGLDVHVGSMTNARELDRCEAQIADAVGKGARVLTGGQRRPDLGPLFFEPTVLVDVDHSMAVMQDETFGPLVPIMRVHSVDEAVRLANDSIYGLSGAVFTRNLKRGEALARRINSGDISINRTQFVVGTPSLPMGGQKQSGIGRRNGPEGLMRYVNPQSILVDRTWGNRPKLTLLDPFLYGVLMILRTLRRWFPFLQP